MVYYLYHHFDPFFDHKAVKPVKDPVTGVSSWYSLGYVQNVLQGQCLAEVITPASVAEPDTRWLVQEPRLPQGVGTVVDPQNPCRLLAAYSGYVLYIDNLICVQSTLNIRTHVDFHTGHVHFVGDLVLHKNLRSGFKIHGRSVTVKGMIEGGCAFSDSSLDVSGGVRSGPSNICVVQAKGAIAVDFCEKATLRSAGAITVQRFILDATLEACDTITIGDRAIGGALHARQHILIKGDLGNAAGTATPVFLGYDPLIIRRLDRCNRRLAVFEEKLMHLKAIAGHLPQNANENTRKLAHITYLYKKNIRLQRELHTRLAENQKSLVDCRLVVLGKVMPGVTVSIGSIAYSVRQPLENVTFFLCDGQVNVSQAAASC